jgi:GAF domain-containing protein
MWSRIREFLAPPTFGDDEEKNRAARLLNATLWIMFVFALVVPPLLSALDPRRMAPNLGSGAVGIVIAIFLWILLRQGRLQIAGTILVSMLFIMFAFGIYSFNGVRSTSITGFFLVVLMAGLLLGQRAVMIFGALSILTTLAVFYLEQIGFVSYPERGAVITDWIQFSIALGLTTLPLRFAVQSISQGFQRARRNAEALRERNQELEASRNRLEDRTHDLERRTRYLQATADIARDATSILEPQELSARAVNLISEYFEFYHTGLFMLDDAGEWAVLQAASSEGGQRMLAQGHRLRVGQEGIVGYVTGRGEARISLDVGQDAVFFDNPNLPQTRSEMTLPLRARGEIIGALDIQSRESGAFSQEDAAVLQILADQIAMAISNARLFEQVQESLEAERRAFGELSREAWQQLTQARTELGFLSDTSQTVPAGDTWHPEMRVALQTGEITSGDDGTRLAIPIKVRDEVVGVIDAIKPEGKGDWTSEEIAVLETLIERVGVALESARLYEDTQRRAARERLTREITDSMRRATDIDELLQTTVQEIGNALGMPGAFVRLNPPEQDQERRR